VLQVCLNGSREPGSHPALPLSPQRLAADAAALAELGVAHFHLHPRDVVGRESLAGPEVATAVAVVRAAVPRAELGVTTAAWVEPDPRRRADLVRGWSGLSTGRPDVASVNVHEDGWLDVAGALHAAGVGLELGVFHERAARALVEAGLPAGTRRVLAEIRPAGTAEEAAAVLRLLEPLGAPVLLHGEDDSTWPVLELAARLGLDTRVGLEDTLRNPDGAVTRDNAELVTHAQRALRAHAAG